MGLRIQAYILGAVLILLSSWASALGLGEITLKSALNQPLNAEIELRNVRGLTEREIRVGMASHEAFANAGVERAFFLTDFEFNVDLQAPGGPVVRVTSSKSVREPFLNFIVQAQWPSGRLLREYTVLVDLPVFTGTPAEATRAAPSEAPRTEPEPAPRRPATQPPAPSRPTPPQVSDREYGPVSANENLWSIATRSRPDSSVTVQQTMLAIQRLNPDAFINDNINLLRRGHVLRLPDRDQIQQLNPREAINEVAAQNQRWSDRVDTARAPQLEGRRDPRPTPSEPATVEGRVKLSSQETTDELGVAAGQDGVDREALTNSLNVAQEQLDAAQRENSELRSRLQAMEEQVDTMERLLQVSSDEMRALELIARQAEEARQIDAEEAAPAEPEVVERAEPEAVEETPVAEETPVPPESAAEPFGRDQKTLVDQLFDNLLYLAIGLGALVIAVGGFIYMRRRDDGFDYDDFEDFDEEYALDEFTDGETAVEDGDDTLLMGAAETAEEEPIEEDLSFAEAETEDVVAECDIHIAYGQYSQAEEKLLRALEYEPANSAMRLKLLEAYAAQGDADSFDHQYARLRALGDTSATDRAEVLRSTIAGIGAFDPNQYDTSEFAEQVQQEDRGSYSSSIIEGLEDVPSNVEEDDTLQFNLDAVDELVDTAEHEPTDTLTPEDMEPEDREKGALDFDLDLDTEDLDAENASGATGDEALDLELADDDFDVDFDDLDLSSDEPVETTTEGTGELSLEPMEDSDKASDQGLALEEPDLDFDVDDTNPDQDNTLDELERLTSEFSENVVAEKSGGADPGQDLDFDFGDLELDQDSPATAKADADDGSEQDFDDGLLDFDLDDEDVTLGAGSEEEQGADALSERSLGLDDDIDELDLTTQRRDTGTIDDDLRPAPHDGELEDELSALDDFDTDVDLDSDLDLDQLDQELDSLSGDLNELEDDAEQPAVEASKATASEAQTGAAVAADTQPDFEIPDFDPEEDDDSNLEFLSDSDETATKLDLARAYIDMGDTDGARDILDEIAEEGTAEQKQQAQDLLARV